MASAVAFPQPASDLRVEEGVAMELPNVGPLTPPDSKDDTLDRYAADGTFAPDRGYRPQSMANPQTSRMSMTDPNAGNNRMSVNNRLSKRAPAPIDTGAANLPPGAPGSDAASIASNEALIKRMDASLVRAESDSGAPKSRRRSMYFGQAYDQAKQAQFTAKEDVYGTAPVTADIKTNVMIDDEYTFLTNFSAYLANRYQRSQNAIFINLQHSACLLHGGSFDPAYHLTISALPNLVQTATNKRNAALISTHLADELGVPARRGIIAFVPVPESNLAHDGATIQAELDIAKDAGKEQGPPEGEPVKKPRPLSMAIMGRNKSSSSTTNTKPPSAPASATPANADKSAKRKSLFKAPADFSELNFSSPTPMVPDLSSSPPKDAGPPTELKALNRNGERRRPSQEGLRANASDIAGVDSSMQGRGVRDSSRARSDAGSDGSGNKVNKRRSIMQLFGRN